MPERTVVGGSESVSIVVVSDTHVPQRARALPKELWRRIEEADVVVHAGDWVSAALLDEFESRARQVVGVWGNNDGPELRSRLPEVARLVVAGTRIDVVHETGNAQGRERRMDERHPDADVLIFGHSHIPWDTTSPAGMRLLNPGSPTDRRRQPFGTYITATVCDSQLEDVEFVTVRRSEGS